MSQDKRREIGEGDRESARRYNKHTREFVEAERRRKARKVRPGEADDDFDEEEWSADELREAEKAALERARERDPQVSRDYHRPTVSRGR